MSGVQAEAQETGCRMPGDQVGAEFITLSNHKRLPTPLIRPPDPFDPTFGLARG